jgi:transcriptional regulator with XRE-family HTH domain
VAGRARSVTPLLASTQRRRRVPAGSVRPTGWRREDLVEDARDGSPYAVRLGERLRNVRQQQGLSLHDVEGASGGQMKASVVGAYERGERAISVSRLRALAGFYRVPIAQLLADATARPEERPGGPGLRVDLTRLEVGAGDDGRVTAGGAAPDLVVIGRYLRSIQSRRGDYNGRILTMRSADVQALAAVLDTAPGELTERLIGAGIAASTGS